MDNLWIKSETLHPYGGVAATKIFGEVQLSDGFVIIGDVEYRQVVGEKIGITVLGNGETVSYPTEDDDPESFMSVCVRGERIWPDSERGSSLFDWLRREHVDTVQKRIKP